jgi:outer membrane receptor protein involved in Fe transport
MPVTLTGAGDFMRKILLFAIPLLFITGKLFSQEEDDLDMPGNQQKRGNQPGRLYGKVVEVENKAMPAASVEVFMQRRKAGAGFDSLVAGMLTRNNGEFSFENFSMPDSFAVKISNLGYTTWFQVIRMTPAQKADRGSSMDLGNIRLDREATSLQEVKIVATKPTLQMGIDRKVFSVDKSFISTGGTAIDVMRNIPSVSVDVNGEVQLRNASPQIFVDGRPTILTLQQIPADDIERVELITNPSAKFDAATTGGIINVVLKKSRRNGLNGVVTAGVGYPEVLTGNLSLNMRQGKFNFFTSANYNQNGGVARSEANRANKENGIITDYFNQETLTDFNRRFFSVRFGADYFINNRNTLTVSQNFVKGENDFEENQSQEYLDANGVLYQVGERQSISNSNFNRSNTQLNYKHDFPKSGHELTADLTYNQGDGANEAPIANFYYLPDGTTAKDPVFVRNQGNNRSKQLTIQADYVNPISDSSKLEAGVRAFINDNSNLLDAYALTNGGEVKLPLSTNVQYKEQVYAAYSTYTNKWKGIRYQVGLRAEYSRFDGLLVDSAQNFGYTVPSSFGNLFDGLFPSLFLTRELREGEELQLNFSRRIRRPNFWQLNPYVSINDPQNISVGNPNLRPEYVNAFEFNYGKQFEKGSFLGVLYFHNNDDDITRYSDTITEEQYDALNNAAIEPNAIVNSFINAQYTNRIGAEFTYQKKFGNLEVIPNINLQYRRVKAVIDDVDLSNEGFNWEGKLILNYATKSKIPLWTDFNFQLNGQYESQEVIPQGKNQAQFVVDLAIRKEFLKQKAAALTFAVNDVFNTNRWGQILDTENFYQDSYRRWRVRTYRLTFTYRFGNRDFQLFGKENNRRDRNGDGDND